MIGLYQRYQKFSLYLQLFSGSSRHHLTVLADTPTLARLLYEDVARVGRLPRSAIYALT